MRKICLYFQVHQPYRLRTYRFFDIGRDHYYYDDYTNRSTLRRIAECCYLPANKILLDVLQQNKGKFKISFSISGTAINQFAEYAPQVLDSFKALVDTGYVEILAETYSHGLSSLKSEEEFGRQLDRHREAVKRYFNYDTKSFRNTELIYSDEIGRMVADKGFRIMLTEGAKHVLGWRSPNFTYNNAINPKLKLLLKNYTLSDDIAFRFSNKSWPEWPLTTEKFVGWINNLPAEDEVLNLFMDYEVFGEHHHTNSGIMEFLRALPAQVLSKTNFKFDTPHAIGKSAQPVGPIHVPYAISWADEERDITAWLGNDMQTDAYEKLYALEEKMAGITDPGLLKDWYYLQTSNHFYYMSTKFFSDGEVVNYFNPYESPYEAFVNYMNILTDFSIRLENAAVNAQPEKPKKSSKKPKTAASTKSSSAKKTTRSSKKTTGKKTSIAKS
jgi:alpha-amylase